MRHARSPAHLAPQSCHSQYLCGLLRILLATLYSQAFTSKRLLPNLRVFLIGKSLSLERSYGLGAESYFLLEIESNILILEDTSEYHVDCNYLSSEKSHDNCHLVPSSLFLAAHSRCPSCSGLLATLSPRSPLSLFHAFNYGHYRRAKDRSRRLSAREHVSRVGVGSYVRSSKSFAAVFSLFSISCRWFVCFPLSREACR